MICNNCGSDIPQGVYACPMCNTPVPGMGGPPPESYYSTQNSAPYSNPMQPQNLYDPYPQNSYNPYPQPVNNQVKNNNNTIIIIAVAVVALVILAIVFADVLFPTSEYDGNYVLYKAKAYGFELDKDQLVKYGLDPSKYSIEIDGNKAKLKFDGRSTDVDVKISGSTITLSGGDSLDGDYDKDERTITLTYNGAEMTFKDE